MVESPGHVTGQIPPEPQYFLRPPVLADTSSNTSYKNLPSNNDTDKDTDISSPTLSSATLAPLFAEITFRHQNLHIHPISPLTLQIYKERGYTPTSEFIVEDDSAPAHIIRTESGWWAWDGSGEYVCFVTADDGVFVRILMEKGVGWAEVVEGGWMLA